MKLNLSEAVVKDFSAIPGGKYKVAVTDAELKESKDGPSDKNPTGEYISWELTVQGGEYDGRKVWKNTPLGGEGLGFLKELMLASGEYTEADLNGDLDSDDIIEKVMGAILSASVSRRKKPDTDGKSDDDFSNNVSKLRPYEDAVSDSLLPS